MDVSVFDYLMLDCLGNGQKRTFKMSIFKNVLLAYHEFWMLIALFRKNGPKTGLFFVYFRSFHTTNIAQILPFVYWHCFLPPKVSAAFESSLLLLRGWLKFIDFNVQSGGRRRRRRLLVPCVQMSKKKVSSLHPSSSSVGSSIEENIIFLRAKENLKLEMTTEFLSSLYLFLSFSAD